ncbi:terminase small subunit [Cypionkella sp.]|uniref:terminase small subunit n=1 Tax=Cypionkella sp. TaxID=2811411 RepID=UPI002716991A|nr:terminase small subunit [Cypionkella sp.]MDO8983027.1 terminase small subunit [Cypionkella sp.]
MTDKPFSDRQKAFVREYLLSGNASDAYRKAGYSAKDANVAGPRLLANVRIQEAIAKKQAKRFDKLDIQADELIARYYEIATADASNLTQLHVGACRHCYGRDFKYQWRTEREWMEEVSQSADRKKPAPDCDGGFGYRRTAAANVDCPECEGLGIPYTVFADTRLLSDQDRALFRGVKQTQFGIEYKMADQSHALDQLAEAIHLFKKRDEGQASLLAEAWAQITARGSKAPIRRDKPAGDKP